MLTFGGMVIHAEHTIDRVIDMHRVKKERNEFRKRLENMGGGTVSPGEISKIRKFWESYAKTEPVFQIFYSRVNGSFDVRYLPDDLYYTIIDPFYNDRHAFKFLDNKCYYDVYFPDLPQPELIAKRINGFWLMNGKITSLVQVAEQCKKMECVFLKVANGSCGGHGVYRLNQNEVSMDSMAEICSLKNDIVIQRKVLQNHLIAMINPNAVNTIRIMTWMDKSGVVSILSKVLRVGIGEAYVDNASSGGIVVGIDGKGKLKKYAFRKTGEKYDCHPTTNIAFEGIEIPGIEKAEKMVLNAALMFPHHRLISWDICIDENETPVLIELNMHHGQLDFHQMTNGPLFGERTGEMLEEVFGK